MEKLKQTESRTLEKKNRKHYSKLKDNGESNLDPKLIDNLYETNCFKIKNERKDT